MIIGFTGSRPDKLGGYFTPNTIYNVVCKNIENILSTYKPDKVISGMALGVDQWVAERCIKMGIPFDAAIPFDGQESKWPEKSQKHYKDLLSKADNRIHVSPGSYSNKKFQLRNEYIVDNSDILVAIFKPNEDGTTSGTENCVNYAKSKNNVIICINPYLDETLK